MPLGEVFLEEKQHDDAGIKKWLDDLRDLAFDLEDIVNEFDTEALRRKLVGENQSSSGKAWNPISALFTRLTPSSSTLRLKIAEITERFDNIAALKDQLDLKGKVDGSSNRRRSRPEPPTSVVNEAGVFGRETDVEAVLKLLPTEVRKPVELTVIPTQGMGGLGKTTLAQLVYNDEKVEKFFELKAWACVSEDFDVAKVTKTILESHTSENFDGKDLNWLQKNLKEKLQGKRFLVVLDDLWNEKYDKWTVLLTPFAAGAPGSTIIITTRNQAVSSMVRTTNIAHHLLPLPDESCLSILILHALGTRDFSAHPHLETVGGEIARKCKGLPLAVKTVGGLLRNAQDRDEWEEVLKSNIWDIPPEKSEIVPALMLSYHHLPSELKRCFAYCSILPKDYEFAKEELVLLWMAEGFIQPREKEKQMEELGREYFQNLVSRSFFQQSTSKSRYLMHDLINDLAQYVAGDTCFRMEDRIYGTKEGNVPRKARHSSYFGGPYDGAKKFEAISHCTCLRTFLPLMLPFQGHCYLTCDVPLQLLPKLRCLRVLSLRRYYITKISDSIGELKQLRYLDLSYTTITGMPESTTTLYNLQTLLLEECRKLVKLPSTFANLVNLRHFNVLGANSLEGLPLQIGKLTCLHTLSNLVVGKENCSGIKELRSLSNLRGTLSISGLEKVIKPRDAWVANLIGKSNLSGLVLKWSGENGEPQDRRKDLEVLNMLQPHESLKELTLRNYGGTEFPTWLTHAYFPNMVLLRIENCKWCPSLPPFGQLPSLEFLFIKGMARVKNIGMEFYGEGCSQPFRSLETLHFENMEEWENWSPCEEFPRLRELSIERYPMLSRELPNQLPLLERIVVRNCARLVVSISKLPALSKITISGCKGLVCRNNDGFRGFLGSACLSHISESASQIEGLIDVEDLTIRKCEELMPLWSNKEGFLQHLSCLRSLNIALCDKLVSLVANETCLPSTLRKIQIWGCSALEHLPKAIMYNNSCLESILINGCDSLRYFARGQLRPTLRRQDI
ncbi:putative disease resistance RPP13-like protein 1 [Morella rubra]|uniref:Putative disease resistance RPP13-like protein 1 n=1 Tax=Morella rubra TaxID=262757 RepID=A0A6A1VUU6_9ROSI|nr:putative disease resistance RPP13-like protein 1 [Morella rubra]